MKFASKTASRSLVDQICKADNINDWVLQRKEKWDEHFNHMKDDTIVMIKLKRSPVGRRSM